MGFSRTIKWAGVVASIVAGGVYLSSKNTPVQSDGTVQATEIKLWRHGAADDEFNANIAAIGRFNAHQDQWHIVYEALPRSSYTESITAAALAGKLPCILELDQPTIPNFAWAGHIQGIEKYLAGVDMSKFFSGAIGRYKGDIYSLGQFDVTLVLFSRKSILEKYPVRMPTIIEPWTRIELDSLLALIKEGGEFDYPFDIKVNETADEWWSYGFSPWLQSFGGDQINRKGYLSAENSLNGEAAIKFGTWFQKLFVKGYVDRTPPGPQAFLLGQAALDYSGSWNIDSYYDKWQDDLLILPVPDFGRGPKTGSGSWQWSISSSCQHPEGAAAFIKFLMTPEEVAELSNQAGFIPISEQAAALTPDFREGGRWRKLYLFAREFSLVRPVTPAYPIISNSFANALRDIKDGGDVTESLDVAVDNIDRNIRDNHNYR